jgi:hypothetical protein
VDKPFKVVVVVDEETFGLTFLEMANGAPRAQVQVVAKLKALRETKNEVKVISSRLYEAPPNQKDKLK